MNFFEIDFTKKVTGLLKAAFSFRKYKEMAVFPCILVGIFMIPFVALSLGVALALAIISFVFKLEQQPVKFIHSVLTNEGQKLSAAAQFIIYFLSWTIVFALYVMLSFMLVYIAILYAILSLLCYVWTLGGIKFHTIITEDNGDLVPEVADGTSVSQAIPWVYIAINSVIYILVPFIQCIDADDFSYFTELALGNIPISIGFSILYSAIFFTIFLKKKSATKKVVNNEENFIE
ncbi:MAG: hypothetical protein E7360_03370 [Clostridiales bacterium]|nr:hypothetical protein [Clostridiales bacterium]